MEILLPFIVNTLFSAFCLWLGMKITKVDGTFLAMLIIAGVSSIFSLIPYAGGFISMIVMFVLIYKWTDANLWPDAVLMVIVAWGAGFIGVVLLASMIYHI